MMKHARILVLVGIPLFATILLLFGILHAVTRPDAVDEYEEDSTEPVQQQQVIYDVNEEDYDGLEAPQGKWSQYTPIEDSTQTLQNGVKYKLSKGTYAVTLNTGIKASTLTITDLNDDTNSQIIFLNDMDKPTVDITVPSESSLVVTQSCILDVLTID